MRTQQLKSLELPSTDGLVLKPTYSSAPGFELRDYLTIGRDPGNDLQLSDQFASQRHARIEKRPDGAFWIRDLQSTNGTYVNGLRITECRLQNRDRISFGETEYLLTTPSDQERLELTSKNAGWALQLAQIPHFAKTEFPVLILGPSGTGKELLAQSVHDHSLRQGGPLVSVNCSTLSEALVESELFGHVKGSFTGATHDRKGAFEAARGGTLFLDEIGDLPLALQPKLLRALENSEIRPVGDDRTIKTDVRIVAATHQALAKRVADGQFRSDLYFRLNVIKMETPRLKDRLEDLPDLVHHFCRLMRVSFSHGAILQMQEHCWPGNIRELRNVVARAAACFPGVQVEAEHLKFLIESPFALQSSANSMSNGKSLKDLERDIIVERLLFNSGNQRQTSIDLGMPKSTLHDRIKLYKIDVKSLLAKHTRV